MAQGDAKAGKTVNLYAKLATGDEYRLVGCATQVGGGLTSDSNETVTNCGVFTSEGPAKGTISYEGVAIEEGDTETRISLKTMKSWKKQGLRPFFRVGLDDTDPNYIEGKMVMGDLSWTNTPTDYSSFTLDLSTADDTFKIEAEPVTP